MVSVEQILRQAVLYDGGDSRRIHHFLKVYSFAKMIGEGEHLSEREQYILEVAAVLHDIGIHASEEKYGSVAGNYQELEGPPLARELLQKMGVEDDIVDRVCYLIGHHHTYGNVDGMDYQILIEADFFVNAYEDAMSRSVMQTMYGNIFRTETGKMLFYSMYLDNGGKGCLSAIGQTEHER